MTSVEKKAPGPAGRGTAALVVLVHGIWMVGLELQPLAFALRRAGFRTHTYHYRSILEGLAPNAARLAAFLARQPPGTHVIGHSLGGLLAARAVCDHPAETAHVGRVVALGAPLLGSGTARAARRLPFGRRLVGRCFAPESAIDPGAFLRAWISPRPLGIIAGTRPVGVGHLLLRALPLPNDGVVALEETLLPGAAGHITVPVNHFALSVDRRSTGQAIHFLRHARFEERLPAE